MRNLKLITVALLVGACSFTSIQTDGVFIETEWKDAVQYAVGNGNKVYLKEESDVLYVALVSTKKIWSHFYLSDGKRVKVMHASAALGAIEYNETDAVWLTKDRSFVYELRNNKFNEETSSAIASYYSKNGWVANNNNLGDGRTIEAKFNLSVFKPKFFACVIATVDQQLYPFPVELNDDAVLTKLVQGNSVDSLKFQPIMWHAIKQR